MLTEKAFNDDWFNKTHKLNLSRDKLIELLPAATMNQLFQFNGNFYEQADGIAMGSPLGRLLTSVFMCSNSGLKVNDQLVAYATRFLAVRLKNHVWSHHRALKAKVQCDFSAYSPDHNNIL